MFDKSENIIVPGGFTGSGKTEILKELKKHVQVIDLEGYAHHKGSAFGFIGQKNQPSTEQFENNIASEWLNLNLEKEIWLEDESRSIGKVNLPDNLYAKIRNAPVVFIEIHKELRIKRLVKEYTGFDNYLLQKALDRIKKRIGGLNHKLASKALENNNYTQVADITLTYYDKAYKYGLEKRKTNRVYKLPIDFDNPHKAAKLVLEFFLSHISALPSSG